MLTAERIHELMFEREKSGITSMVYAAVAYYSSPSEPSLYKFLKSLDELLKNSTEEIEEEFQRYFDVVGENIAELFWQAISDCSSENLTKTTIILTVKMAEKTRNQGLKYIAAHCLYENKLFKESSKMLAMIPGANPDILIMEGMCFYHLNQTKDALASFESALSLAPNDQTANKFRILCLVKLNRSDECLVELDALWQQEKSAELLMVYLDCCLKAESMQHLFAAALLLGSEIALTMDESSFRGFLKFACEQSQENRFEILNWLTLQPLQFTYLSHLTQLLTEIAVNGPSQETSLIQLMIEKIVVKSDEA